MTMKKYFQLVTEGDTADIDIYGDISSWSWSGDNISAANLSKQLEELGDVSQINVHINSYGGEVAEGLAIYNALRRHKAKVVTTCDGFACSIASVIFMAGDERLMSKASLLMIHNAWTSAYGVNANDLRKLAEDMDAITARSKAAYLDRVSIDEDELSELMDAESWISPDDAVEKGFATGIEEFGGGDNPSQSAFQSLMELVKSALDAKPKQSESGDGGDEGPDDDDDGAENPDNVDEPEDPEDPDDGDPKEGIAGMPAFLKAIAN